MVSKPGSNSCAKRGGGASSPTPLPSTLRRVTAGASTFSSSAQPCAGTRFTAMSPLYGALACDGHALATRRKQARYLGLVQGGPPPLCVLAAEVGGRWWTDSQVMAARLRARRASSWGNGTKKSRLSRKTSQVTESTKNTTCYK